MFCLASRTNECTRRRVDDLAARTVRRRYLAVVLGVPDPASGRVNAPIGRDPRDRLKMGVVHGRGEGGESLCV